MYTGLMIYIAFCSLIAGCWAVTWKPFRLNKFVSFSYSFSFEDEGVWIQAWFGAISTRARIYVDGKLVYSRWIYQPNSPHAFQFGGNEYAIVTATNLIKDRPWTCTLCKNGSELKRQRLIIPGFRSIIIFGLWLVPVLLVEEVWDVAGSYRPDLFDPMFSPCMVMMALFPQACLYHWIAAAVVEEDPTFVPGCPPADTK